MDSNILKNALISEKSFAAAAGGKFTFVVDRRASKDEVKAAVVDLFDVTVLDVNIVSMKGKVKRSKKGSGKRSDFKKAILTLKKGQKIDLFEAEKEEKKSQEPRGESQKNKKTDQEKVTNTKVTVRSKKEMPRKVI